MELWFYVIKWVVSLYSYLGQYSWDLHDFGTNGKVYVCTLQICTILLECIAYNGSYDTKSKFDNFNFWSFQLYHDINCYEIGGTL